MRGEYRCASEEENVLVLGFVNALSLMGCIVVVSQVKISSNVGPYTMKKKKKRYLGIYMVYISKHGILCLGIPLVYARVDIIYRREN